MSGRIVDTFIFILPVVAATSWILIKSVKAIGALKKYRYGENKFKNENIYISIVLYTLVSISGMYLTIFMIWMIYYPTYNISIILKIIGYFLYAGFWGGLLIISGLSHAAGTGAGSISSIIIRIFDTFKKK